MRGGLYKNLGKLKMTIVRTDDDVFTRPRDPAYDPVAGYNRTTITSERNFMIQNYGTDEVAAMYRAGMERVEAAAVSSLTFEIGFVGPSVSTAAQTAVVTGSRALARVALTIQSAKIFCSAARSQSDAEVLKACPNISGRPREPDPADIVVGGEDNITVRPRQTSIRLTDAQLRKVHRTELRIGPLVERREYVFTAIGVIRRN